MALTIGMLWAGVVGWIIGDIIYARLHKKSHIEGCVAVTLFAIAMTLSAITRGLIE